MNEVWWYGVWLHSNGPEWRSFKVNKQKTTKSKLWFESPRLYKWDWALTTDLDAHECALINNLIGGGFWDISNWKNAKRFVFSTPDDGLFPYANDLLCKYRDGNEAYERIKKEREERNAKYERVREEEEKKHGEEGKIDEQLVNEIALYIKVLELTPENWTDPEAVNKAFKAKARLYHPDRVKGQEENMKLVSAARDFILKYIEG